MFQVIKIIATVIDLLSKLVASWEQKKLESAKELRGDAVRVLKDRQATRLQKVKALQDLTK